jgi:hypothetical protein
MESVMRSRGAICTALAISALLGGCASAQSRALAADPAAAERLACADVSEAERDLGPFAPHDRVVRVEPVNRVVSPKAPAPLAGVALYVRATPGLTEQWVDRVIECHVAHHAAHRAETGAPVADDVGCPLAVDDTRIAVSPTSTGFRVAITSPDPEVARELLEKGRALAVSGQ